MPDVCGAWSWCHAAGPGAVGRVTQRPCPASPLPRPLAGARRASSPRPGRDTLCPLRWLRGPPPEPVGGVGTSGCLRQVRGFVPRRRDAAFRVRGRGAGCGSPVPGASGERPPARGRRPGRPCPGSAPGVRRRRHPQASSPRASAAARTPPATPAGRRVSWRESVRARSFVLKVSAPALGTPCGGSTGDCARPGTFGAGRGPWELGFIPALAGLGCGRRPRASRPPAAPRHRSLSLSLCHFPSEVNVCICPRGPQ